MLVSQYHNLNHQYYWHWNYIDYPVHEPEPARTFSRDDIKMEHHPSSNIEAEVYAFNDFKCRPVVPLEAPSNTEPWCPFYSRLEFEVTELALEAGLNNEQTDWLIKICHRCAIGKENFTFKNHKDIHVKWEAASFRITKVVSHSIFRIQTLIVFKAQFTKEVISVPYDGKTWNFDLHYRDLWGLASDLLGDPHMFPHFTFDAQHLSKFDGESFVHFVDEPYTAQDFWDVQAHINTVCSRLLSE